MIIPALAVLVETPLVCRRVCRRQLESAEAKWHLRHQQDSPGTVIENVSVGWLNLLLQVLPKRLPSICCHQAKGAALHTATAQSCMWGSSCAHAMMQRNNWTHQNLCASSSCLNYQFTTSCVHLPVCCAASVTLDPCAGKACGRADDRTAAEGVCGGAHTACTSKSCMCGALATVSTIEPHIQLLVADMPSWQISNLDHSCAVSALPLPMHAHPALQ